MIMFKEKVMVITGASSGLGFSLAKQAHAMGARLALCARNTHSIEKYFKDEKNVFWASCDVASPEALQHFFFLTRQKYGKIDIIIANAGKSMWARFSDISSPHEIMDLMGVNFLGVVNSLYYGLDDLKKNKGSFVAISSIQGDIPSPYHSGYVSAKHAVTGFIETLRMEEKSMHFLLVSPGWIGNTSLRKNSLKSNKEAALKVKETHSHGLAMDSDKAANLILEALAQKKIELYLPNKYKYLKLLRCLFKNLVDRIIQNKVENQLLP